ncbi:helix-hairpin-helix domain-containing protein [Conexibacter sp. CPCC 206217]|uniref:helix-hairpin-helix domain-containing protein n=1 Tax=Conexibacter sp. CPCC 206217 TaxID=3064574 RepID=UPI002722E5AC|nr:helix-hairpin-helix domain-containing protein [Conexibacter sp. CPCC 206217]MDO8213992.1 helix-hairpin-helix domain-containing protein [Conexibacter sp. CPCC 206217]
MPQPTKPQLAIYAALAIAVLLIGARFLRTSEGGGGVGDVSAAAPLPDGGGLGAPDGNGSAPAIEEEPREAGVVVDVKGAVRRPGVYRLQGDARALDAVRRAGGLSARADRRGVNLAARVVDGGEVVVPRRGERVAVGGGSVAGAVPGAGAPPAAAADGAAVPGQPLQIDLNTATAQELEVLDGVGPATAAKIVAYREQNGGIGSIDELDEVSGIGEAKLAAIRAQLGR